MGWCQMERNPTIDLLKGLAILGIILLHALPISNHENLFYEFHYFWAVPVFIIILTITNSQSPNSQKFGLSYLWHKAERFGPASLVALIGLLLLRPSLDSGGYFIPLLIQFIFLFPFLRQSYQKHPRLTLMTYLLINLAFEIEGFNKAPG